ncbi:MAG: flagellar filament capping protein FliD [Sphingomonadaceae bacterium]
MAITSPIYDPTTTATKLATSYVAGTKAILDDRGATADATANGLTTLGSALNAFQTAIGALASSTSSISENSASFSSATIGSASAKSTAVAGTYSFYVEQLATAGQVSYGGITDSVAAGAGNLTVTLADGTDFQIDLANADGNRDGVLSAKEIAAAINIAAGNNSRVTASTLSVNGTSTLVLTSAQTGAAGGATLDTSGVNDANLKSQLDDPLNKKQLVTAQDAIIWIGAQTSGTRVQQASNTFNLIDDVSLTFSRAQAVGESPVTLTVAPDNSATASNVQAFVDAYNKLNTTLAGLTSAGNPNAKPAVSPGIFANDAGLSALRSRMAGALRSVTGGQSLIAFGITANRNGSLTIDSGRLNKAIAAHPGDLDALFGKSLVGAETGVLGSLGTLARQWTSSSNGQITSRTDAVSKQQKDITTRQATLQTQYDNAYKRYLKQFTALQDLQSQMTSTSNIFTALFSSSSSSS